MLQLWKTKIDILQPSPATAKNSTKPWNGETEDERASSIFRDATGDWTWVQHQSQAKVKVQERGSWTTDRWVTDPVQFLAHTGEGEADTVQTDPHTAGSATSGKEETVVKIGAKNDL